ncbi:alpha-L-fucosidase [Pontiella sulfatireligans]|uniref:alpha-L-fucosidase n=1 Tax=Pontiella sulfatireligans TaxID=2750658 RepID=UPI001444904A|nr:alpha-L-fucosidase [Pontiella sulfatireligans]
MKNVLMIPIALFSVFMCSAEEPGKFTSETLAEYGTAPWFGEAKLGVSMHWSLYSVPAYKTEWYPNQMYYVEGVDKPYKKEVADYHRKTFGDQKEFGYKDFVPMFKAENFDADYYADLVKKSGAGYFVAPAIHHDGFAMWDSEEIEWNAVKMGPKRDIVQEFSDAMRKQDIKLGVSTHYGRHWRYYTFRPEFDNWDPRYEGLYGKRRGDNDSPRPEDALQWERVLTELIDNYQPDYTFIDGGICDGHAKFNTEMFREALYRVTAYYYNQSDEWGRDVVLTWKRDAMKIGEAVYDTEGKQGVPGSAGPIAELPWESHMNVKKPGWCYIEGEKAIEVKSILAKFIDVVSRNGNLMLNLGPKADGTLPKLQEQALLDLGEWMAVNGEGITGSRPWKIHGTGEIDHHGHFDKEAIRFTQKADAVYAYFVTWPDDKTLAIPWGTKPGQVDLLGAKTAVAWEFKDGNLIVKLPKELPCKYLWGLKIGMN